MVASDPVAMTTTENSDQYIIQYVLPSNQTTVSETGIADANQIVFATDTWAGDDKILLVGENQVVLDPGPEEPTVLSTIVDVNNATDDKHLPELTAATNAVVVEQVADQHTMSVQGSRQPTELPVSASCQEGGSP